MELPLGVELVPVELLLAEPLPVLLLFVVELVPVEFELIVEDDGAELVLVELVLDIADDADAVVVPATFIWPELSVLVTACPLNWKFPDNRVPVSMTLNCKLFALSTFRIILKCPLPSTWSTPIGLFPDETRTTWLGENPVPLISTI